MAIGIGLPAKQHINVPIGPRIEDCSPVVDGVAKGLITLEMDPIEFFVIIGLGMTGCVLLWVVGYLGTREKQGRGLWIWHTAGSIVGISCGVLA
ncbi:MAG: hypothetical protein AAF384_15650, partial [Pseudomonadota bacterium]